MHGLTLQSCTTQLWLWKLRVLTQDILAACTGAGWALMHLLGTHTWANRVLMPKVTGCSHRVLLCQLLGHSCVSQALLHDLAGGSCGDPLATHTWLIGHSCIN